MARSIFFLTGLRDRARDVAVVVVDIAPDAALDAPMESRSNCDDGRDA
jgi:hypothetical protein